jgi:hypothetical protein
MEILRALVSLTIYYEIFVVFAPFHKDYLYLAF